MAASLALLLLLLAQDDKVYKIGEDGVKAPKLVFRVEPQYTDAARDAQVNGVVTLSVEVSAQGKPENVKILKGLEPSLDRNAAEAVGKWKFAPGTKKDGSAVRVRATIEINFRNL